MSTRTSTGATITISGTINDTTSETISASTGRNVQNTTGRTGSIIRKRVGVMTRPIITRPIIVERTGARPTGPHTGARKRERFGRAIAPSIGSMNTTVGANAEDTGATAFQTIASARILAVDTGSEFAAIQSSSWADTRDFSTEASGSASLIRGRNTGRWERTWYDTDDVYVDYVNDGYYMYNRRHPGVGIAVNVSF